ncbi:pyrroline-5-carboxylate reductase 3-like [Amphibalanus amphitrite]|uniref:pyrroline-5-carboxylate reductase 3-like n=1 Tax=Amphibalanus amphitrite TaxID=1232801 RepID=UPI001C9022AD|nr:pyrroline-5-carboxylate reductase 3-like [Amphibalanus amphitrite]XP_043190044.1 pyrroline-5-carboxylate reductase 3-like [Amphibalanus amphitrite]XP_043190045.1 pyrroline-5-carboxylate reductase 3-like [Amphibalanus amphitrite]XP_043190046.1 pyrroline-5-carboxylate reductase 3-like [Amphibalanus amphitrite]XP_043190047.1 pyrroline-5-carboxylate reductase 3-like [Amphibalanus amphitrite]
MDISSRHVGFIGAGNMAKAIGKGIIQAGLLDASHVHASAPSQTNLKDWASWGAVTTTDNCEILEQCDVVFLAVKPHLLERSLEQLSGRMSAEQKDNIRTAKKFFVSVIAGLKLDRVTEVLEKQLDVSPAYVIRTMPSTPCMVGEGICAYCVPSNKRELPEYSEVVERIYSAVGRCKKMDEMHIDAVGGAFGSGTAFVFTFIDAMASGAVKMGLPWATARELAAQTVLGAGKMVLETGRHPCQLRDEVSSPGGATIAGLHKLEDSGHRSGVMSAIEAAVMRSKELGNN